MEHDPGTQSFYSSSGLHLISPMPTVLTVGGHDDDLFKVGDLDKLHVGLSWSVALWAVCVELEHLEHNMRGTD